MIELTLQEKRGLGLAIAEVMLKHQLSVPILVRITYKTECSQQVEQALKELTGRDWSLKNIENESDIKNIADNS